MKKVIFLFVSLLALAACTPGQKPAEPPADASQTTAGSSFGEMTEDEREAYMIQLIEKEESRMKETGEL